MATNECILDMLWFVVEHACVPLAHYEVLCLLCRFLIIARNVEKTQPIAINTSNRSLAFKPSLSLECDPPRSDFETSCFILFFGRIRSVTTVSAFGGFPEIISALFE